MIRAERGDPPDGFDVRADGWRARFAEARREDAEVSAGSVWRSLRAALRADADELSRRFHHKCAYCESRMRHVSHAHIEHYRPKSRREFEHLMFDWGNWLLSCGICNEEKWADFPQRSGAPLLLNPADEDPAPHLAFAGPHVRGVTERGCKTVELVQLDRQPLRSERASWLTCVDALLLLWVQTADQEVRRECRQHLVWALQDDAPYAGMTRAYLRRKCPRLASPPTRRARLPAGERQGRIRALLEHYGAELAKLG